MQSKNQCHATIYMAYITNALYCSPHLKEADDEIDTSVCIYRGVGGTFRVQLWESSGSHCVTGK